MPASSSFAPVEILNSDGVGKLPAFAIELDGNTGIRIEARLDEDALVSMISVMRHLL